MRQAYCMIRGRHDIAVTSGVDEQGVWAEVLCSFCGHVTRKSKAARFREVEERFHHAREMISGYLEIIAHDLPQKRTCGCAVCEAVREKE